MSNTNITLELKQQWEQEFYLWVARESHNWDHREEAIGKTAYLAGRRAEYIAQQNKLREKVGEVWDAGEAYGYHQADTELTDPPPDKETTINNLFK